MGVDFTYAVARVRAIEAAMPDRAWFMRIARIPAGQIIAAAREYYPGFDGIESLHRFESALEADAASLHELLSSILGGGAESIFLRAPVDFDNYVMAVKGAMLGVEPVLLPYGPTPVEVVERAAAGDAVFLPVYLKNLHDKLTGARTEAAPVLVDREGERAKWEFLLGAAPSSEAARWARLRIDSINLKSFARFRMTGLWKEDPADAWIPGGTIDVSKLDSLRDEPLEDFFSFLEYTEWRGLAARGFEPRMDPWMMEAALRGEVLELMMEESRARFFDVMPLLYHVELRERNAIILRTILTGRINGLPEEMLERSVETLLS